MDLTGKICIKLKISHSSIKQEEAGGGGGGNEIHDKLHETGFRVCDICGKSFSSGKAWGGHKRHHLKVMRENNLKKAMNLRVKPKKINPSPSENMIIKKKDNERCNTVNAGDVKIMRGGKPICCLCGKIFSSMNLLFGHMRFHPDRGWKGTQPPPPPLSNKNNSSLNIADKSLESNVELLSCLSGWLKTDRRGRASSCGCDPVILQGALDLIRLLHDYRSFAKHRIEGLPGEYQSKKKQKINDNASGKDVLINEMDVKGKVKGVFVMKEDVKLQHREEEEEKDNKRMIKKKIKSMKIKNLLENESDSESLEGGFKCSCCSQSFPTFQALRGHRISCPDRNKNPEKEGETALIQDKYTQAPYEKTHKLPASEAEETEGEGNEEEHQEMPITGNSFECEICSKNFPTGQALGGHKRCHWKSTPVKVAPPILNNMEAAEANHVAASVNRAASGDLISDYRLSGIDLNDPCVFQQED